MYWKILSLDNQNIFLTKNGVIRIKIAIPMYELKLDIVIKQYLSKDNIFIEKMLDELEQSNTIEKWIEIIYKIYDYGYKDGFQQKFDTNKWYFNKEINKWVSGIGSGIYE